MKQRVGAFIAFPIIPDRLVSSHADFIVPVQPLLWMSSEKSSKKQQKSSCLYFLTLKTTMFWMTENEHQHIPHSPNFIPLLSKCHPSITRPELHDRNLFFLIVSLYCTLSTAY